MNKIKIGRDGFILLAIILILIGIVALLSFSIEPERSEIITLTDLNGKSVGVQSGTLYEDALYNIAPNADIVFFTDPYAMLLALDQGKLDAALTEDAAFTVEQNEYPSLKTLDEPTETLETCVAFGNTDRQYELYDQFEKFLRQCNEDGSLDEMKKYWLKEYKESCKVDKSGITGENGTLSVAIETTYMPFEYLSNGAYEGFDIDLIYRFSRMFGYEPIFTGLDYDAIAPALSVGKYDLGVNIIYDEERSKQVLFSSSYLRTNIIAVIYSDEVENADFFESIAASFHKTFIKEARWKQFAEGLGITFLICFCSIFIGTILGIGAYLLCYDGDKLANGIMSVLCEIFSSLPSVVLLMIVYYIVFGNIEISNVTVAVIAFSLMFCCSVFGIIKTGVSSIGIGQYEASRAQGFSSIKTFIFVIFPQVCINQLPTFQSEISSLIKETSIVGYIAVADLTKMSDIIRGRTFEPFFPLIVTAIIYYIVIRLFSFAAEKLMSKINPRTRKPEKIIDKLK